MLQSLILIGLMVNIICLVILWPRRQLLAAKLFLGVLVTQLVWEWGYLLEVRSSTLQQALFWDDVQFLPYLLVTPFWLYLCRAMADKPLLQGSGHLVVTLSVPVLVLLHVMIGDPLELIRVKDSAELVNGLLVYDFGTLTYLSALWSYALLFISMSILILFIRNLKSTHRTQVLLILIGILLPSLLGIPSFLGVAYFGLKDVTPFSFALGNLFILYGLFRLHTFEFHLVSQLPVLTQLPVGVLILDHKKRIIDWNPLALTMLDISISEPGLPCKELPIFPCLKLNETCSWRREDQHYDIEFRGLETVDKLDSFVITIQNISNLVQQQQSLLTTNQQLQTLLTELQDTQNQLLSSEKQKSVITLVQSLAHEFNTPLGNLVTLLDGYQKSDDKDDYVPLISSNVERVISLISKIKRLADLKENQAPETFFLDEAIDDVIRSRIYETNRRDVRFVISVESDLRVHLPRRSLESTLLQLIDNSLSHAFDETISDPTITIEADSHESGLHLLFKDNGKGIPQAVVKNLFMPFSDLTSKMSITKGVGLFSIHQWITQNIQGDIQLIVPKDGGTAFAIDLPINIETHPEP